MKQKFFILSSFLIVLAILVVFSLRSIPRLPKIAPLKKTTKRESALQITKPELAKKIEDYYNVEYKSYPIDGLTQKRTEEFARDLNASMKDVVNNTSNADITFEHFISDPTITRAEKILTLWQLAKQLEGNNKYFVLDYLEMLEPVELVQDFINVFNSSSDNILKSKLIRLMSSSLGIANPESQSNEQLNFIAQQSIGVSHFLEEQLTNNPDQDLLNQALWYYPTIAPADEVVDMLQRLMADNKGVPIKNIMNAWAAVSFSDMQSQSDLLPKFLSELEKQPEQTRNKIGRYLYPYFQAGAINPKIKDVLLNYLENSEPRRFDSSIHESYFGWLEDRYNWFDSYASLQTNNITEKNIFFTNTIINSKDPIFQANLILYLPSDVLNTINDDDRNQLINGLQLQVNDNTLSDSQRHLFSSALSQLQPEDSVSE